jgi:hypothetical protein
LALLTICGRAQALDGPRVELELEHPAAHPCMTREQLAQAVEQQVGGSLFVAREPFDLRIHASITRRDGLYVANVQALSPAGDVLGERELTRTDADCHELDASISLIVALLVDQASEPALDEAHTAARRRWSFAASGQLQSGLLPRLNMGFGSALGVRVTHGLRLALTSMFAPSRSQRDALRRGVDARAWSLGAALCPLLYAWTDRALLEACATTELGALHAQPLGLLDAAASRRALAQEKLELTLTWRVWSGLGLRLGGGGVLAFTRPGFSYASSADGMHREVLLLAAHRVGGSAQFSVIIGAR